MKRLIAICVVIMLLGGGSTNAGDWTAFDPLVTEVYGISDNNVVGWSMTSSGIHGFHYDGLTWTDLQIYFFHVIDMPGATVTIVNGISGSNIVGVSDGHGFLYDGTTWTPLDYPGASSTEARGISGSNIVGTYYGGSPGRHGFLYDGTTWTTLDYPGASDTSANGISGSRVVGGYNDSGGYGHGFLYDGTTWTRLDYPGALATEAYGISGSKIVGRYWDWGLVHREWHGFVCDGTTWTTLKYPGAANTYANAIDGNTVVGSYEDLSFKLHSFSYAIPADPCSPEPVPTIPGDLTGDYKVDFEDLAILASNWLKGNYIRIVKIALDSDPGWTTEGQWQFGTPMGMGGSSHGYPDPNQGFTGQNVYDVNLNGDYTVAVGGPYCLTAGPFNCSGFYDVKLRFARWLNTDEPSYVTCKVEASNDGTDWYTVWENTAAVTDSDWQIVEYDVSVTADNEATVYFRWSYEILDDRAYPYSGWNIDDIELLGKL